MNFAIIPLLIIMELIMGLFDKSDGVRYNVSTISYCSLKSISFINDINEGARHYA